MTQSSKEGLKLSDQADPFAASAPQPTDDPFANPPAAPVAEAAPQPAVPDPVEQAAAIPVVDKEGQAVTPGPLETTPEDRGEPEPVPAPAPVQETPPAPPAEAPAPAPAPPPPPAPEPTPEPPVPEPTPAPAPEPEPQPEPPAPPAPAPAPDPDPDPPAAQAESSGGGKEVRYYKVLYQTGEHQFTVADLTGKPNVVELEVEYVKGQKKKEKFIEARNGDHALKLAFVAVGRPVAGVTLLIIPKGSYKPRPVKAAPPSPERERLTIG